MKAWANALVPYRRDVAVELQETWEHNERLKATTAGKIVRDKGVKSSKVKGGRPPSFFIMDETKAVYIVDLVNQNGVAQHTICIDTNRCVPMCSHVFACVRMCVSKGLHMNVIAGNASLTRLNLTRWL